ncbi:hypothetical protein CPB84DRAFT_1669330 [Gymnopilus junonius]|uniref:Uncharacterized protein n=1 Tax=Gymnopilus junonius TaxID=109634 RepID=A0A9P5P4C8_GYMJU|nr:hypothetical protein CPB84DRAFT_1669330 [Gymnopilus junonius]
MASGCFLFLLSYLFSTVNAQNISTTTPVPPLQWINLTGLLQGSTPPPPLADAVVGYDDDSRTLIIFGGLAESGLPQSQTYLLNLQTLTWSTPVPPANLQLSPPARSAALSGMDVAASNRHGFVVIGGKGSAGEALSDIWEYGFNPQFWTQVQVSPGGPSARWGASGGIDIRTPANQDPVVPGPNNTFYLAGGSDGKNISPLSDVWRLNVSGILSSNLPTNVQGSWEHLALQNLPGRVDQAGAVVGQQVVAMGGCVSASSLTTENTTCARQDAFVINTVSFSEISPGPCPAPRVGSVLVPNMNGFSQSFASQLFLLLGDFNSSLWQDSNGLAKGEVAILDLNTNSWTRVLPAGDPDSSGNVHFPSARTGASGFSFPTAIVGNSDSRNFSSDSIIFGGQDSNGNFLSEVWLLRAYTGIITPSNPTWAGFGDGHLQTGVNADGSGVRVTYLTECASSILQNGSNSSAPNNGSNPDSGSDGSGQSSGQSAPSQVQNSRLFDTSPIHKFLVSLSLVVLLPILLCFRWTPSTLEAEWIPSRNIALVVIFTFIGFAAYSIGIVGFIFAFITLSSNVARSSQNLHLKTAHGIVGLIFFLSLYVIVPLLYLILTILDRRFGISRDRRSQFSDGLRPSVDTNGKAESGAPLPRSVTPSALNTSPPSSPRPRTLSWDASNVLRPSQDGGMSGESTPSATVSKSFEVLNRPGKTGRRLSGPWPTNGSSTASHPLPTSRTLGEIDWLLRRRSLSVVGELDYAITQAENAQNTSNNSITPTSPSVYIPNLRLPRRTLIVVHILTQVSIMGLCAATLAELWSRAPRYLFAIFLVWSIAYYIVMISLAWVQRPATSILTVLLWRLRGNATSPVPLRSSSEPSAGGQGPYTLHRPPYHAATHVDETSYIHTAPLSVETDDNDDDLDEDTRQRLIEEEMERREVSIITVPRRKLLIANPS